MTTSYANLFGTNGSGTQTGIGNLFGQQRRPRQTQPPQQQQPQQSLQPQQPAAAVPTYQQTFAQMQQQGQARPAPAAPQANTYQTFTGSQQAQAARAPMLQAIQQQLAQPTRFDTDAFNQIRQAQTANLNAEFGAQRSQLEEEMARRGLSASTIGAGRYGDLAGQQARAQASLDAQLLQQAAQTQAADRLAALQAAGQFTELAGSQDLAQFEANRVGQAQRFQEQLAAAQFGQGQTEFDRQQALQAAQLEQTGGLSGMDLALRTQLGLGGLNLDAARLQQQGQLQGRELDLRAQQLQQEAALQGRSLSLDEARLAAQREQFTATQQQQQNQFTQSLAEQQAQRQLQQLLGQTGFDIDRERLEQQGTQFDLEQALRERLGLGNLDLERQRLEQQGTQFGQQLTQEQRQFQLQLAAALSGLTTAQRNTLLNNPAFAGLLPGATTGTPTGTPTPGSTPAGVPSAPIGPDPTTGGFLTPEQESDIQRRLREYFEQNPIGG